MAMGRIRMSKIRDVLRLRHEQGLSIRKVAQSCNISRPTVTEYLEQAERNGIEWFRDKELSESDLEKKLWGAMMPGLGKAMPDWRYVHEEMKKAHVTMSLLWQEYKEANPAGYQQSQFGELYRQFRRTLNVSMRQEHRAGEKLFVDYTDGIKVIDRSTGEEILTQLFVSVWGASNCTYAEASLTQNKRDWIMSHVRALEYYGCVPKMIILDNLKSGVTKACRYEPELNASYLDLARHYGFCAIAARPYRPKDKAKVEAGVLVAQRWILASLRNRRFYSLSELNAAIRELLEKLNNRMMQKLKKSRKELFESLDRPAASALMVARYEYAEWKKARVNIDYHVEVDHHYYSVPYQLVRQEIEVRVTDTVVEMFYKGVRQASHVRSPERNRSTTNGEHMPESHRKHMEWNPSRILSWAEKVGPCTKEFLRNILEGRKYPELGYRSCLGILRLSKHYAPERLENACKRGLYYRTHTFHNIKSILENGMDKQQDLIDRTQTKAVVSPVHENIRGLDYYGGSDDKERIH
jgi:transposase